MDGLGNPSYGPNSRVASAGRICYHSAPCDCLPTLLAVLLLGGCAGSLASRLTLPERNTLVRDQLVIHGDFPLAAHHRLFEELTAQRADLCRGWPCPAPTSRSTSICSRRAERFQGFMRLHYPEFPDRRAFFVETDAKLSIYAQWGDRMGDDLRHEVTHGYLHAVVPNVPLWLDEGIAKFFEVPRGQPGAEPPAVGPPAGADRAASTGSPTCGGWSSSAAGTT